ncbi:MAG: tRNA (5-methylaminomethyl-2-thiouridine)(34)-methyltransferase MnmD [Chitinispirillales bacterium]|jgi:tRNA 5-methylaminomethyl-2-thiouridine biosynthesis bifunctional protein|nr:tRNA (5-methylaminomethyl-2-thiouridine)(34)-methyltransferase MnmD [Chitinispirillales bacterium]
MNIPDRLLNEHYGDRYFDVVDALEEAKRIHIGNARVVERVNGAPLTGGKKIFRVGETGFGAGRLLVALMGSLDAGGVRGAVIDYHTVELHPITAERMGLILYAFRDRAGHYIDRLIEAYSRVDAATPGLHGAAIAGDFGVINLRLYIGEALSMVESLGSPCAAWFLDGHAPKKNPDIWRAELLSAIGKKTERGGTATTFTVAGHVRRGLEAAGFAVEKVPGCGGKKEAVLGTMLNAHP